MSSLTNQKSFLFFQLIIFIVSEQILNPRNTRHEIKPTFCDFGEKKRKGMY